MNGPSAHISWAEMACKDARRTPYPVEWRESRAVPLSVEFEAIRGWVRAPIRIGSAYRTFEHNRAVGGARTSQHIEGRALDLYPPPGMSVTKLYEICRARAGAGGSRIGGLGKYPTFVHIDIRPISGNRLVMWSGSRAWAEVK